MVAKPLGRIQVVTCATPAYLKKHGTPNTSDDLEQNHCFVNFFSAKTGRVFPFDFQQGETVRQITRPHRVCANDADAYIAAGMGVMQIPCNRVVRNHLQSGQLVRILADWSSEDLPLMILYLRNRHLTGKVRAFVN